MFPNSIPVTLCFELEGVRVSVLVDVRWSFVDVRWSFVDVNGSFLDVGWSFALVFTLGSGRSQADVETGYGSASRKTRMISAYSESRN